MIVIWQWGCAVHSLRQEKSCSSTSTAGSGCFALSSTSWSLSTVGLEVVYTQFLDVKSGRTVRSFVSCFSALVTREQKWLCFPTSINIHRNRVSRGRSMLVICAPLWSLKSNGVEGGWTGRSRSNTRSSVGRSEGFIGGLVLVNGSSCSVPVHWNHVGGMSRRHGCYSILNLSV